MPLEYFVYAFFVIAAILLVGSIAIFLPHLRREAQADAAQTRELRSKATEADHGSAS